MKTVKSLRDRHAQQTTATILKAATAVFVSDGYALTTIGKIARKGRVTSGAIYHHYEDKKDLFQAVAEQVTSQMVSAAASAVTAEKDPWKKLSAGVSAVLSASSAPEVKLAFLEAPMVLGLDTWRAIELKHTAPLLTEVLESLIASKQLSAAQAPLLGRLLRGVMVEAAMAIAESTNAREAQGHLSSMVDAMIMSLKSARRR